MNILIPKLKARYKNETANAIYQRLWILALRIHLLLFASTFLPIAILIGSIWATNFPFGFGLLAIGFPLAVVWVLVQITVYFVIYFRHEVPDEGLLLTKEFAPELFKEIDEISKSKFGGLIVHRLWLTYDINAGAYNQRKSRGLFQKENHIRIGLPIFYLTTVAELRGIIAHEMHHLHAKKLSIRKWIRLAQVAGWNAQFYRMHFLVRTPLRSLHRQLWAHQIVLDERHEYVADQAEVETCSPMETACTLLRSSAFAWSFVQHPPFKFHSVLQHDSPPANALSILKQRAEDFFDTTENENALRLNSLAIKTPHGIMETHPELPERLAALGVDPESAQAESVLKIQKPAVSLLRNQINEIEKQLNQIFFDDRSPQWKQDYDYYQNLQSEWVPEKAIMTVEQAWASFHLAFKKQNFDEAERAVNRVLAFTPNNKIASSYLAKCHLKQGVPGGELALEEHVDSPSLIVAESSFTMLREHYTETFDRKSLRRLDRHVEPLARRRTKLDWEMRPTVWDTFTHADLPEKTRMQLQEKFTEEPSINKVHIARKQLKNCVETKFFVIAIAFRSFTSGKIMQRLRSEITIPIASVAIVDNPSFSPHVWKIRRCQNSEIYCRKSQAKEKA